jgi:3-phosphoshikimate 1-carboxyvinyltransferase
MRGIGEMRVKESDRIALMAAGLAASGIWVEEEPEGLIVMGTARANHPAKGGAQVVTKGDHRIAMSHLVMGLASDQPITVDEPEMIATSFPTFVSMIQGLGGSLTEV